MILLLPFHGTWIGASKPNCLIIACQPALLACQPSLLRNQKVRQDRHHKGQPELVAAQTPTWKYCTAEDSSVLLENTDFAWLRYSLTVARKVFRAAIEHITTLIVTAMTEWVWPMPFPIIWQWLNDWMSKTCALCLWFLHKFSEYTEIPYWRYCSYNKSPIPPNNYNCMYIVPVTKLIWQQWQQFNSDDIK